MPDSGTPVGVDPARRRLAGPLLVLTTAFAVLGTLGWPVFALLGGLTAWGALVLLLPLVMPMMRRIALALLAVGGLTMVWAWLGGQVPDWRAALASNVPLIGLLIAATFLQLLVLPRAGPGRVEGAPRLWSQGFFAHRPGGSTLRCRDQPVDGDGRRLEVERRRQVGTGADRAAGSLFYRCAVLVAVFWRDGGGALLRPPAPPLGSVLPAGLVMSVLAVALTWWGHRPTGSSQALSATRWISATCGCPGLLATLVVGIHLHWPALSVLGLIMLLEGCPSG
jgi:hypothetical protein